MEIEPFQDEVEDAHHHTDRVVRGRASEQGTGRALGNCIHQYRTNCTAGERFLRFCYLFRLASIWFILSVLVPLWDLLVPRTFETQGHLLHRRCRKSQISVSSTPEPHARGVECDSFSGKNKY